MHVAEGLGNKGSVQVEENRVCAFKILLASTLPDGSSITHAHVKVQMRLFCSPCCPAWPISLSGSDVESSRDKYST